MDFRMGWLIKSLFRYTWPEYKKKKKYCVFISGVNILLLQNTRVDKLQISYIITKVIL